MPFWNDPTTLFPKQAHRWVIEFATEIGANPASSTGPFNAQIKENKITRYFAKSCDRPSYEIGIQDAKYLYSHTFKLPKRVSWKPITMVFYDTMIRNAKINKNISILKSEKNIDLKKKPDGTDYKKGEYTPVPAGNALYGSGKLVAPSDQPNFEEQVEDAINITQEVAQNKTKIIKSIKIGSAPTSSLSVTSEDATNSTQLFFYNFLQTTGYVFPENLSENQTAVFRSFNFKDQMKEAITQIYIKELDEQQNAIEQWQLTNPLISSVTFDKLDYSSEEILKITVTVHYDWARLVTMVYPAGDRRILDDVNINVGAKYLNPTPQAAPATDRTATTGMFDARTGRETSRFDSVLKGAATGAPSPPPPPAPVPAPAAVVDDLPPPPPLPSEQ